MTDVGAANVATVSASRASRVLTRASSWGSGENHVLFHYGDYGPPYDYGRAILAKSSFAPLLNRSLLNAANPGAVPQTAQARAGYDVTVPLPFYRCGFAPDAHLTRFSAARANGLVLEPSKRPVLASFKGVVYGLPDEHFSSVRQRLAALHNERDVLIGLSCWTLSLPCSCRNGAHCEAVNASTSMDARCAEWGATAASIDFETTMLKSRFALVAPGEGAHSYRLYEALQAGAIPVLLGASAAPLDELIDWDRAAVVHKDVTEVGLTALMDRLRRIDTQTANAMAAYGWKIFTAHFQDLRVQIDSTFAVLAGRFRKAQVRDAAEYIGDAQSDAVNRDVESVRSAGSASGSEAHYVVSSTGETVPDDVRHQITLGTVLHAWENMYAIVARQRIDASSASVDLVPDREYETLSRKTASKLIAWLASGEGDASLTAHSPSDRAPVIRVLTALSQIYALLGEFRHASTAAQVKATIFQFDGAPPTEVNYVTLRLAYSVGDARREPRVGIGMSGEIEPLHRRTDASAGGARIGSDILSGYGALAHFIGPTPLGIPGLPSIPLPVALGHDCADPDAILPFAAVTDSVLRAVAANVTTRLALSFREFLAAEMSAVSPVVTRLRKRRHDAGSENGSASIIKLARSRFAVVSMCAYNASQTALADISIANLRHYCERHGYDCLVGTQVLDSRRPPAWSKVLLVAQFLPAYDWVLWRDCDTFFMSDDIGIEVIVAAAGAARAVIANAAARAVGEDMIAVSSNDQVISERARAVPLAASTIDLIVSEDGFMLNTGVFLLRNCKWARALLAEVYGVRSAANDANITTAFDSIVADVVRGVAAAPRLRPEGIASNAEDVGKAAVAEFKLAPLPISANRAWEQAEFVASISTRRGPATGKSSAGDADDESWRINLEALVSSLHTQVVPQPWLNSYPDELAAKLRDDAGRPLHAAYRDGDTFISFSGCGVLLGAARCEDLFSVWAARANQPTESP